MGHTRCACRHESPVLRRPVTATQTVAEIAHRSPAARAVLTSWGVEHRCGAHLSLAEAAAAAGVPLDRLLTALNQVA